MLDHLLKKQSNPSIFSLVNRDFPVKLFVAKYTYDPTLYSPNADHELELPLIAGDRVYVYGDVDKVSFLFFNFFFLSILDSRNKLYTQGWFYHDSPEFLPLFLLCLPWKSTFFASYFAIPPGVLTTFTLHPWTFSLIFSQWGLSPFSDKWCHN